MERDCESELSKLNIEQNACIYHFGASVIHGQRSNILRLPLRGCIIDISPYLLNALAIAFVVLRVSFCLRYFLGTSKTLVLPYYGRSLILVNPLFAMVLVVLHKIIRHFLCTNTKSTWV